MRNNLRETTRSAFAPKIETRQKTRETSQPRKARQILPPKSSTMRLTAVAGRAAEGSNRVREEARIALRADFDGRRRVATNSALRVRDGLSRRWGERAVTCSETSRVSQL